MTDHLITQEQLDQLRQIAENATPGPWIQKGVTVLGPREPWDLGTGPARIIAAQMPWMRERMEANAAHAAAFDPPTVLALIERLEAAEAAAQRVREVCESSAFDCTTRDWGDLEAVTTDDVLTALNGGEQK